MNQLQLLQPVIPFGISQHFGENGACINNKTNEVIAWSGNVCPIGFRSLYGQMKGHNGVDLHALHGQEVHATHDGVVCEVVSEKERGLGIGIVTNERFYCQETKQEEYFKTRYWHHLENKVKLGDKVKAKQVVGLADNTGYSSGDHLHFELKPVKIVATNHNVPVVENLLQDNGYFGAVDPIPYFAGSPYLFSVDLKMGTLYDREVELFQAFLVSEGFLSPIPDEEKGYYGKKTRDAVFAFQKKYVGLTWWERTFGKGDRVGSKTRSVANTIITRKFYS